MSMQVSIQFVAGCLHPSYETFLPPSLRTPNLDLRLAAVGRTTFWDHPKVLAQSF